MTSVKLGACIHIVGLSSFREGIHHWDHHLSHDSSITEIYSQSSRRIGSHWAIICIFMTLPELVSRAFCWVTIRLGVGLKKRVVRPVGYWIGGFSGPWEILWVRELLGIDFPKVLNYNCRALRLPIRPVVEALEGKWGSRGTIDQRRGTLPWVGQVCGEWGNVGC